MPLIAKITENKQNALVSGLSVDLSLNRYDLTVSGEYDLYDVDGISVPVVLENEILRPGLYLTDLGPERLRAFAEHLLSVYPAARAIRFFNIATHLPGFEVCTSWLLHLSGPVVETFLAQRNGRFFRRRRQGMAARFKSVKYERCEEAEEMDSAVRFVLNTKRRTHGFHWSAGPAEYRREKAITHVYRLRLDDETAAVELVCETNEDSWFFENTAYDDRFAEYSPGICLVEHVIGEAIRLGCKRLYLGVGTEEYKKFFGAVPVAVCNGWFFRDPELGARTEKARLFFTHLKVPAFFKRKLARLYGRAMLDGFHRKILTLGMHGPTPAQRGVA